MAIRGTLVKRDYYETLGVNRDADDVIIKQAYRRLATKYHPDRNNNEKDGEKFKKIIEAYQRLRLEEKKKSKASETEVASKYTEFWKKYDNKMNEDFKFGPDFSSFRQEFGARTTQTYEHNQEKEGSPMSTHVIIYGGLGAIALWIILSSILK